jgi:hypothetical protein
MDDLPRLNRMQSGARASAAPAFDWQSRGERLAGAVRGLCLPAEARRG